MIFSKNTMGFIVLLSSLSIGGNTAYARTSLADLQTEINDLQEQIIDLQNRPQGRVLNVTIHTNNIRRQLFDSDSISLETFSVDKLSPTSTLLIQATISAQRSYSGSMMQGWQYGTGTEVTGQNINFSGETHGVTQSLNAVIFGHTTIGTQTLTFRYFTQNGETVQKPFEVYNPNATDDNKLGATESVYAVWEIEMPE